MKRSEIEAVAVAMAKVIARRHGEKDVGGWLTDARYEEARAAIRALDKARGIK